MRKSRIWSLFAVLITGILLLAPTACVEDALFEVSSLTVTPSEVLVGEPATITIEIRNIGEVQGTYSAVLMVEGEVTATEAVAIAARGTETVSFILVKDTAGIYELRVDELTRTLVVLRPAEFEVQSITVDPAEAGPGELVLLAVDVKNVGDIEGTYAASLTIDGEIAETRDVWVASGTTETLTFAVFFEAVGSYDLEVGGQSQTLLVVPVEFDLSKAIDKMPEFYTQELDDDIRLQYYELVSGLSLDAQKWIASTGRFLEDKSLDSNEVDLLRVLSAKEDPLFYLTMPKIMYGISSYDVSSVERDDTSPEDYMYLRDDVEELEKRGLLPGAAKESLDRIVTLSEDDYELRKGLYLINHFGYPRSTATAYTKPDYNTQLFVLGALLEKGVPAGYEGLAVAAALAYGTLITIGDDDVQRIVPDYAHSLIEFIADTDRVVKEEGAHWQARYYPLEAGILLVWGAPGTHYWAVEVECIFWTDVFMSRRMNLEDFHWLFVSIDTLVQKRDWMIEMGFVDLSVKDPAIDKEWVRYSFPGEYDTRIDVLMDKLNDYLFFGSNHFTGDPLESVNVEGRIVRARDIYNPDWQWNSFVETGRFYGTCLQNASVEAMLAKAVSISAGNGFIYASEPEGGIYTHTIIRYYDPIDGMLKTTPCQVYFYETTIYPRSIPFSHDGYIYIPWDNFCASREIQADRRKFSILVYQRSVETAHTAFAEGYPAGYLFRHL